MGIFIYNIYMKTLVTGGAGYIGSHAVYELIRAGHEVVVLDDLSTGNKEAIHKEARFYEGDQRDSDLLNKIFTENNIDVVMHFSAKLIVPESVEKPIDYFENNIHGVAVLLKSMKEHNIKNIVFSSTAATYGDSGINKPLKETDITQPINPYGESKLACEWLIKGAANAHNMNYVIFRYFNVAGADISGEIGQATKGRELTHLIPVVIEAQLGLRNEMQIFGDDYDTRDGTCVRDYIHVSDLAKAHILGAEYALSGKSNIFNLGSKNGFTVKEVVFAAKDVIGKSVPHKIANRRMGDPAILIADNKKAYDELGFGASTSLKEMIKSDFAWRNNKKF